MCMMLLLVGTSCSDSESTPEPEPVIPPKITLDSESEFTVTDKTNQISISFTTNKDWTISSNQSWCSASTTKGSAGKITVPIDIEKNETYDSREATLSILSGTAKQSIKIVQAQMDAIVLANNSYEVEAKESTMSFEVQSNVKFTVKTDVDWISEVKDASRGLTTYKLNFLVKENTDSKVREGHIQITKDNIKQIITVKQKESIPQEIAITHNLSTFTVPQIEGTITNGQIFWGDDQEMNYERDAKHTYEMAGNHTVIIKMKGAEGMNMKTVKGILSIDLSKF